MAWFRTSGNNGGSLKVLTASGDIATFETNLVAPLQNVTVNVLATGGNGTPDNPNPINGYSSANITRCGVNLFDKTDIADGYIDDTTGAVSGGAYYKHTNYLPVAGGQKIYIMTEQTTARWGAWYDKDKNYISGITNYLQTEATAPNNACFIRLTCKTTDTGNLDTFAVNYPSTPTYTHYNGQTYTVNFGQTIYGGQLDVTRGKLHVTHAKKTFTGASAEQWYTYHGGTPEYYQYTTPISDSKNTQNAVTNMFELITAGERGIANGLVIDTDKNFRFALLPSENITDEATWRSFLSNNNLEICYELATPFDIDLTPEVISAIVGENNVFADCGQTTVKYLKRE